MKKCSKCKEVKDFSEFHKSRKTKSGCQSKCKACRDSLRPASIQGKTNRVVSDLEGEIWVSLKDFEGIYMISNKGRVKSLERKSSDPYPISGFRIIKPSILKITYSSRYPTVRLTMGKKSKNYQMHVLMYKHFGSEAFDPKKVIDHKNNNPKDFSLDNLQQITQRHNYLKDTRVKKYVGAIRIKPSTPNGNIRWVSRISIEGKKRDLGRFSTPKEAHERYMIELERIGDPVRAIL